MSCTVTFKPAGLPVTCARNTPLIEVIRQAGISLQSICGGIGACGRCRVRILLGNIQSPNAEERKHLTASDLADGYRLACQVRIAGDTTVDIPFPSLTFLQTIPLPDMQIALPPLEVSVHDYIVETAGANLHDAQALWKSLATQLIQRHDQDAIAIDAAVLASLPDAFRAGAERLRISLRGKEAISIRPADRTPCGLAIDLGTTTMAGYLVDLENGKLLSACAVMNPQRAFGEDVMSRIACVMEHGDRELRRAAADGLNTLITGLCVEPERIVDLTLVGNTAMHHIFLGLPVRQLGRAPYQPSVREPLDRKARDLGLAVAPGAYVHLPPPVGGFVGSDHLAMILATGIHTTEQTVLALDIGTNTEAALAHRGMIKSISCASGPALEGGHLTHGTWAVPGAIDRIRLNAGGVSFHTIGQIPPHGLCGSGIIDAISALVGMGMIDRKGGLAAAPFTKASGRRGEFILVPAEQTATGRAITISQKDVSEVQLAKAAIRAGIDILLDETGVSWESVDEVILTGGFGTVLDPAAAIAIGMLPPFTPGRIRPMEQGAGTGAVRCLISAAERREAAAMARRICHVELMTHPAFKKRFGNAMYFPG
jgi:uncharacterized 2Fe-2S/4Fe-4S cluster protein (DUF4445 family)